MIENKHTNESRRYIPEFDGVRGIAALSVVLAHCSSGNESYSWIAYRLGLGSLGVDLFFTLSGLLITGILLNVRDSSKRMHALGIFFVRRSLRILPLYYLAIIIAWLFFSGFTANIWWFALYAVNIGKAVGVTGCAPLNHFWSLAVEEQFYLLWPLVVIFCSNTTLVRISIGVVILSLCIRFALSSYGANDFAVTQLMPCCLEPLALGGLVALFRRQGIPFHPRIMVWAVTGFSLTIASMLLDQREADVVGRTAHAIWFAPMLWMIADSCPRLASWTLSSPIARYLGCISYGLYVWHIPIMLVIRRSGPVSELVGNLSDDYRLIVEFIIVASASILVASASWFLFERWFIQFKKRFA